jgi:hypothetical protein
MIEFKIISIEELKDLIYLSYENDTELVKKFHSINIDNEEHSLEECVDTTYNRIIEAGEEVEHDIFKVLYNGEDIGYMVIFGSVLYSFAIFPSFRKKDILCKKIVDNYLEVDDYELSNNTRHNLSGLANLLSLKPIKIPSGCASTISTATFLHDHFNFATSIKFIISAGILPKRSVISLIKFS